MFKKLQDAHKYWAEKNFGDQYVGDYTLGMIEEVGELAHSVLKRKQGIRNTEDHGLLIRDAIGDITIFLVGFCNCEGIEIDKAYADVGQVFSKSVQDIAKRVSKLVEHESQFEVTDLLHSLKGFCLDEDLDYEQTVLETWVHVVSKRDWKNNPNNLGASRMESLSKEAMVRR